MCLFTVTASILWTLNRYSGTISLLIATAFKHEIYSSKETYFEYYTGVRMCVVCQHSWGKRFRNGWRREVRWIISTNPSLQISSPGTSSSLWGDTIYLNLTEEDFVPDAVTANDPAADFSTFSLGSEVEQPTLQRAVGLAEDLQGDKIHFLFFFFFWLGPAPSCSNC